MSVRNIVVTDEQLRHIRDGLVLLIPNLPKDSPAREQAELLLGCARATLAEPECPLMIHGWAM